MISSKSVDALPFAMKANFEGKLVYLLFGKLDCTTLLG
jgi:hypothetical protein